MSRKDAAAEAQENPKIPAIFEYRSRVSDSENLVDCATKKTPDRFLANR